MYKLGYTFKMQAALLGSCRLQSVPENMRKENESALREVDKLLS